jgi:hypothetical protein
MTNTSTIIASNLRAPGDIYIDQTTDSLYVAETFSGQVRMWTKNGSINGVIVLGSNMQTTGNPYFSTVSAVWVDDSTKVIYIADQLSGTIQRWYGSHGDIIAGKSYIHIDY